MTDYNATYIGRIVNGVSQLGNAISGGSPDISISARIGQKQHKHWFWSMCAAIVNFTFYPIDGHDHCLNAYFADRYEDYSVGHGNAFGLVIMTILMLFVCSVAIPFTWLFYLIKKIL